MPQGHRVLSSPQEPNNDKWKRRKREWYVLHLLRRPIQSTLEASLPLSGVGSKEKSTSRMPQGNHSLRSWKIKVSVRSCRLRNNLYKLFIHYFIIVNFKKIAKFFNFTSNFIEFFFCWTYNDGFFPQ